MPACGSNEQTQRLRSAIGFSVGTDVEMHGDICSTRDDTTNERTKDLACLICQRESCITLSRRALIPARAQKLLSERTVRTCRLGASPERSLTPGHLDVQSERRASAHGLPLEPTLTPTREPTLDPALTSMDTPKPASHGHLKSGQSGEARTGVVYRGASFLGKSECS